jgi:hypothetical protein
MDNHPFFTDYKKKLKDETFNLIISTSTLAGFSFVFVPVFPLAPVFLPTATALSSARKTYRIYKESKKVHSISIKEYLKKEA